MDDWLDRCFGAVVSIGMHLALLLGMTLVMIEQVLPCSSGGGSLDRDLRFSSLRVDSVYRGAEVPSWSGAPFEVGDAGSDGGCWTRGEGDFPGGRQT